MILNFDRGSGQNSEQMVQSLMESTQLAFDTLERKLGLSGGSLIDDDGNVVTVTKLVNKSTDKIEANYLSIKGELYASEARIVDLEASNVTINDTLKAHDANIDNLEVKSARIDSLETSKADIDLANVNNAWITNGVIKDASIANEKVISVSANKLTAGTIDASKITVTNLNADNLTVGTINGERIGNNSIDLNKLSQEVPTKEYLDSVEKKLQEEIDGAIETFTVSEIPTLNNEPAVNWTTDDIKATHIGDLCYVVNSASDNDGFCYRFQYNGTEYSWALIKDNDVTKAIQDVVELGGEVTQLKTDFTSKVSEIDGGIESLKSRTTIIETTYAKSDDVENALSSKVETSVFNTLNNTVDENSSNITKLTETVTTKADGSKVTALENKTSTIEQNLNGITTKVTSIESQSEGLDTRLTVAESNITTTANEITTKVSKNEVISAINQTAESVSINASKINLSGAVTFTSFDSSLQNTINNKAESSTVESVKTIAQYAKESIDNLEIGGRNLFIETDYKKDAFTQGSNTSVGWYNAKDLKAQIVTDDVEELAYKDELKNWNWAQYVQVEAGQTYTCSCDVKLSSDASIENTTFFLRTDVLNVKQNAFPVKITKDWQRISIVWTCVNEGFERFHLRGTSGQTDTFLVKHVKLEKGNKPTDWTPAPEDVDAGISNAQSAADTANTTANAARDKILSWCHENNQTLIDGAKIYTGSIDAESINVESLTADAVFIDEMETNLTRFKAVGDNEYYETEITGEGINFKYGTIEENARTVAAISGDELQIKKTSVLDEMKIGKWSWKVNPNNSHLTLRWNGGDE